MQLIHDGVSYECARAVMCEEDCYIRLYDAAGKEIAAFFNISDFSQYTLSGGEFSYPDCGAVIPMATYLIGSYYCPDDYWTKNGVYYDYTIEHPLITHNMATCIVTYTSMHSTLNNIKHRVEQDNGKIIFKIHEDDIHDLGECTITLLVSRPI